MKHFENKRFRMVSAILATADLTAAIPENARRLASNVSHTERTITLGEHTVWLEETSPPPGHFSKGSVLLLHGQSFLASTWRESARVFAATGIHCYAPDLPGCGRTKGPAVPVGSRPEWLSSLREALSLSSPLWVVCASESASFVLPHLLEATPWLKAVVAVAPAHTTAVSSSPAAFNARTPLLLLYGEKDTSLGPTAAANLRVLPSCRAVRLPEAGHAAHLGNPLLFQSLCLNFFDLIRSYDESGFY